METNETAQMTNPVRNIELSHPYHFPTRKETYFQLNDPPHSTTS